MKEADDDGFEPLSFVLPKKRKSREKQRPPRKWYNEKMEAPHEQLCLKMCFKDQHQFRELCWTYTSLKAVTSNIIGTQIKE